MNKKHYEIVTDVDKLNVDLQQVFRERRTIKQWAYIVHDKDDTRPHYHIYINFGNASVDSKLVADWFKIPENFVSKVEGRKADMLLYLTHANESQQNKHQYSPDEVVANFDFKTEIESAMILGHFDKYSYAQQLTYIHTLPKSEQRKYYTQLKALWDIHCQWLTLHPDRDISVIFICGQAGTGKTYYAKKLLKSMGYDFCLSSSSNDVLQDYMGQKAIILDDLRDDAFEFPDLLKFLDNNTGSSSKSRYANKVFNGDLIVITASVPIKFWYKTIRYTSEHDSLIQLFRRITRYVTIKADTVTVYEGLDTHGDPLGPGTVYINEVANLKKAQSQKIDLVSEFDKICERKELPLDHYVVGQVTLKEIKEDLPF